MIYGISSSLSTFKPVRFQSGLNLVVAEKSKDATYRNFRKLLFIVKSFISVELGQ